MKKMLLFFILIMLITFGCKDKYEDCTDDDYRKCDTRRPDTSVLRVDLTINEENPFVIVKLYDGYYENKNLIFIDTVRRRDKWYNVETDRYYSATATYKKGVSTIVALDGDMAKISSYRMCELRCYEAKEVHMDLRLK
jgi:hypothetical protein